MAGSSLIGNLAVLLTMDTAAFEKGNNHAQKLLRGTERQFEQMGNKIAGVGKTLSLAVTAPLVGFGAVAVREATEAAHAMGQVEAVLKSMGPVAGKTAAQLKKAADAFETQSLFESDEILTKVTANLLTFGNVSEQQFDRAQQAALNLSARLGQDLQSSAIQVGKALNDPIKGMTALTRVGVQFTAVQKEQIKAFVESGQVAKAQGVILAELERQFGGAAQAAQNTDPYNKMTDAFKQMAETVGQSLIPIIPVVTEAVASMARAFSSLSPETQKFIVIAAGLAAVFGPILIVVGSMISTLGVLLPLIVKIGPALLALKTAFLAVRVAALATLPALIPFLVPLAAITAAVIAGYLAWKNWDKIKVIVSNMVSAVKPYFEILKKTILAILNPIDTVTKAFRVMYNKVVGNSYVPDMVAGIATEMAKLEALMVRPAKEGAETVATAFEALQNKAAILKGLLSELYPEAAAHNEYLKDVEELNQALKDGTLSAEQYKDALDRLNARRGSGGGQSGTPLTGDLTGLDTAAVQKAMDEAIAKTQQWREVLSQVGRDLAEMTGDWLASFVQGTAKLKDLWKGIAAYAIRALSSQNGPLQAIFGGARANGGPVVSGKGYLVGENGPEWFSPGRSGQIISNDNLQSMVGGGQVFNIYTNDADSFRRSERQLARDARRRLA